jgi:hypothetical protein
MIKPRLVDNRFYHKIRQKFIINNNSILSYRFNVGIIIFILLSSILMYWIYLDKKKNN